MRDAPVASRQELALAYDELQFQFATLAREEGFTRLLKYVQWARLDARLAEICCVQLAAQFSNINPFILWQKNSAAVVPAVLAVIIDFAGGLIAPGRQKEFSAWKQTVLHAIEPASHQMFFVNDGLPDPGRDELGVLLSQKEFYDWGFFARDSLIPSKLQSQTVRRSLSVNEKVF